MKTNRDGCRNSRLRCFHINRVMTEMTTDEKTEEFDLKHQLICSIIPELSFDAHKGTNGRIAVIGGSREYTGAPYFAAYSALRLGCDLIYVFCTKDAAPVIKSYSPELMVYPLLDSSNALEEISMILPKMHSVVIGPGLGRNESLLSTVGGIINKVKDMDLPMILDADSLHFICKCPDIVRGYQKAILTPNAAEFDRLYATVYNSDHQQDPLEAVNSLCKTLGGITIIRKGREDIISDGNISVTCKEEGSARRCGGQGDLLSGFLGTFAYWSQKAFARAEKELNAEKYSANVIAGLAACMLTRRCNRLAFAKLGRHMTTSDMIKEIKEAFTRLFPVV
ncbi:ATP-dependent (S)-NAD(P)H-hydrate dehydratase-like protein [Leptotrombidium deliense]|uniref:ATP-dependent (S)-NAD(P)H-hydrate dehydratase n=1 Tax=Leptotrombidium deliense TaxID=299467 RepID=A0A443SUH0_9ACAR|nr:ATP-dependent (S)-NAD(P)H-hydrate dehydratase-like protein [Leptotrombidium deliense]